MSSADKAPLKQLLQLLQNSIQEVESIYASKGYNVPSLDSTDAGPFDDPENIPPNLTKAIQIIEGACAQISATVPPPGHVITNVRIYIVIVHMC